MQPGAGGESIADIQVLSGRFHEPRVILAKQKTQSDQKTARLVLVESADQLAAQFGTKGGALHDKTVAIQPDRTIHRVEISQAGSPTRIYIKLTNFVFL